MIIPCYCCCSEACRLLAVLSCNCHHSLLAQIEWQADLETLGCLVEVHYTAGMRDDY